MKKKDIYEGTVSKTIYPCTGIIPADDVQIAVKGAIRGQKVRFAITKLRNEKREGRLLSVIQKADDEIESDCPHFADCGGCCYRTLPYDAQLALKEAQVKELLDRAISGSSCGREEEPYVFEGILPSPQAEGYRNKMEFTFGDEYKDGPLSLGLHRRNSFHDIVPVAQCRIVDSDYRKILACTLDYFKTTGLPYFHRMKHTGYLRHLLIRKGSMSGDILIDLVTTSEEDADDVPWVSRLFELDLDGEITGILHTYNNSTSDDIRDEGTKILYGKDFFQENLLDLNFLITPFSFFQTNSHGAEVLYSKIREYTGDTRDKTIFDLYCGTGTIAQILAPVARKVIGIEIVEEAAAAARVNAAMNGLSNCTFLTGDVQKVLETLDERPDMIVLDPPREGIHPKTLTRIIAYGVPQMIYVSCKPTSLARDLAVLLEHGYRMVKACAVDMFPGAAHVETVVLMSRVEGK